MAKDFASVVADAIEPAPSGAEAVAFAAAADQQVQAFAEEGPAEAVALPPPVKQVLLFPMPLERALYTNARSGGNPNGDLLALYRFRQLVDPVPSPGATYMPSPNSTEQTYGLVVGGARVQPDNAFVTSVLASAQATFAQDAFPSLDGTPGNWRPVYCNPPNWCDAAAAGQFVPSQIDLSGASLPDVHIGDTAADARPMTLAASTEVQSVTFRQLQVVIVRPWLTYQIFSTSGWSLSDESKGFVSSGRSDANDGLLPLMPTSLVIGTAPTVDANWSSADKRNIESATAARKFVSFGPFVLSAPSSDNLFLLAIISSVVPLSPR